MSKPLIVRNEVEGKISESIVRPLNNINASLVNDSQVMAFTLGDDFGPVVYVPLNKQEVAALAASLIKAVEVMKDIPVEAPTENKEAALN